VQKNRKKSLVCVGAALAFLGVPLINQTAEAAGTDSAGASAAVLVNATPKAVWRALHEERYHDPDIASVRVLEEGAGHMMLEEVFQSVPILGSVTAVLEQHEIPYGRIDYSLVKSDKFKSMHGCWLLTPVDNGQRTLLKLTSFIDVGIPFSGIFLKNTTQQKINRRVCNVKELAERENHHLAASEEEQL
jgi:hypothetical protein